MSALGAAAAADEDVEDEQQETDGGGEQEALADDSSGSAALPPVSWRTKAGGYTRVGSTAVLVLDAALPPPETPQLQLSSPAPAAAPLSASTFASASASAPPLTVASVLIAGAGFMCDAYDLFIMNVVLVVLGCWSSAASSASSASSAASACSLSESSKALLSSAVLVGSIVGQLSFGLVADRLGRRQAFILTLSILITGAALSSAATQLGSLSWTAVLALCRFVLGVGVGGEYPLSATVSSEASVATAGRGRRVSLVFSMQGVGVILAPLVVLLLLQATADGQLEVVWRLALGLGALPGLVMIVFRCRMDETEAFKQQAEQRRRTAADVTAAPAAAAGRGRRVQLLSLHAVDLLATAGNWLLFDLVFYSNALFSSQLTASFIAQPALGSSASAQRAFLQQVALSTLILGFCSLPGYYAATLVIDSWGRRRLQLFGYCGMSFSYLLTGLALQLTGGELSAAAFYALYGLSFFFCNMGPNVTTFVIPAELFPTEIRSTCHGISAASGKLGAAVGAVLMSAILNGDRQRLPSVMWTSAAISIAGAAFTAAVSRESQHCSIVADTDTPHDHLRTVSVLHAAEAPQQEEMQQQQQQQEEDGLPGIPPSASSSSSASSARRSFRRSFPSSGLSVSTLSRAVQAVRSGYAALDKQAEDEDEDGSRATEGERYSESEQRSAADERKEWKQEQAVHDEVVSIGARSPTAGATQQSSVEMTAASSALPRCSPSRVNNADC